MKRSRPPMNYEAKLDAEILEAYINKNADYKRADARRIKRMLRKITYAS